MQDDTILKKQIKAIGVDQNLIDSLENKLSGLFDAINDEFVLIQNKMLSQNATSQDFTVWHKAQIDGKTLFKKDVVNLQKNATLMIQNEIKETLNQVNDKKEVLENKKLKVPEIYGEAEQAIKILSNKTLSSYDTSVKRVYALRNTNNLYDAILKQTLNNIEKGTKFKYSNGREVSFKSYMEMAVRTTIRHEANEMLFDISKINAVVFYLCNSFGDCADDHKDFQGKYYFDKDWRSFGYNEEMTSKIEKFIKSKNMKSYQDIVDKKPYLTTRPNCRHVLRPIPLDEVFSKDENTILEEYKMKKGSYSTGKYQALQEQRKNERMIRKYKSRLEELETIKNNGVDNQKIKNEIMKTKQLIKTWDEKQKELIQGTDLKRDKRREDNRIIVQDLGVKYHLGI